MSTNTPLQRCACACHSEQIVYDDVAHKIACCTFTPGYYAAITHPADRVAEETQPDEAKTLKDLMAWMDEAGFVFGLRAQGHVSTVERMLAEGATWAQIGAAIGWDGDAARDFYERFETAPALRKEIDDLIAEARTTIAELQSRLTAAMDLLSEAAIRVHDECLTARRIGGILMNDYDSDLCTRICAALSTTKKEGA